MTPPNPNADPNPDPNPNPTLTLTRIGGPMAPPDEARHPADPRGQARKPSGQLMLTYQWAGGLVRPPAQALAGGLRLGRSPGGGARGAQVARAGPGCLSRRRSARALCTLSQRHCSIVVSPWARA